MNEISTHVTITFFSYNTFSGKFFAFKQMGLRPFNNSASSEIIFSKMLGTGGGNGFSVKPDFSTYSWLASWKTEAAANQFFKTNELFLKNISKAEEYVTFHLKTSKSHGEWNQQNPFGGEENLSKLKPIAVITRATIKYSKAHLFWRFVPAAAKSIDDYKERLFGVGIGEIPVFEQATFSVWESAEAMKIFAYTNHHHAVVVQKTRELQWYSEELFARFNIDKVEGTDRFKDLDVQKIANLVSLQNGEK